MCTYTLPVPVRTSLIMRARTSSSDASSVPVPAHSKKVDVDDPTEPNDILDSVASEYLQRVGVVVTEV